MNPYDEFAADLEGVPLDEVERRWQSGGGDPFADDYEDPLQEPSGHERQEDRDNCATPGWYDEE